MSIKLKSDFRWLEEHNSREEFSSRCRRYNHKLCSGNVLKKRSSDGLCKCPCHEVNQQ